MDEKNLNAKGPLVFSRGEILCALLLYPAAYIYTLAMGGPRGQLWFGLFVLAFVALGEWINRGRPRMAESWVWLGCLLLITLGVVTGRGRAWGFQLSVLLAHPLAVWWLLSRSGALLEGESGHLLPLDAVNGFIRIPFGNFFLRLRCLGQGLRNWRRGRENSRSRFWAALLAVAAALVLLNWAAASLARADVLFGALAENILKFFRFNLGEGFVNFVVRLLLSLPIGAWLFGLIAGSARVEGDKLRAQAAVNGFLPRLRLVPSRVWTICMGAFGLLYLLFFAVQFRYLFGAFTRTLPEGFIVSQYAREGFFELCRVMGINFSLLYLVSRSGARPIREDRAQQICCTVLLAAGMVFAVIAFSKLGLYISCFGFTPRRLQSCWLVLVLFAGSAACLYSLWSGKKSFKAWLMFAAISLALLHLY